MSSITLTRTSNENPMQYYNFNLEQWNDLLNKTHESFGKYRSLIVDEPADTRNAHVAQAVTSTDLSPLKKFQKRCDDKHVDKQDVSNLSAEARASYQASMIAYQNCLFGLHWATYYETNLKTRDNTDDDKDYLMSSMKTESGFAEAMWSLKFGDWWQACYPQDVYANKWTGVDGIAGTAPTGADGGLAHCGISPNGHITGCKCANRPKNENLTPDDEALVYNGTCNSPGFGDGHMDCIEGAKAYAERRGLPPAMRWLAVLKSLGDIMESYSDGVHLAVDDIYFIKKHWPELLRKDCPSAQFYAAYRPMPYLECIDYEDAANVMHQQS